MKTLMTMLTLVGFSFAATNCAYNDPNSSSASRDATTGSLIGAGAGAILGKQSDNTLEGALIGAAVGGAGGYLVGDQKDRKQRY